MASRTLAAAFLAAALLAFAWPARSQCLTSGSSWQNSSFPSQSGTFSVSFDATPNVAKMDGVTGLSLGGASGFTSLATAVRFNNTGFVDARNGSSYAAAFAYPYGAGQTFHFRLVVNVAAHTYTAYITPPGLQEQLLGSNYAFRADQSKVSALNNWALFADAGSHKVCNFALAGTAPPPPPPPPPAVTITAPAAGTTLSGSVAVTASASSSLGIASVQFLLDGSPLGSAATASPYSTTWNTSSAANGAHTLSALATDTAGNKTTSAGVAVTVNNAPPTPNCPTSGSTWQDTAFTAQTAAFQAAFDATPSMANMDGITGLSMGPASAFSSLATIVRFNNTGTIDARNGGAYAAAAVIPYTAGSTYHIRQVVDPVNHVYSVYVTPPGAAEQALGLNYAFRSEQAATSTLNNWAIFADAGTHQVCNFTVTASAPPPPPPPPPPTVTITAPAAGTTLSGSVAVTASASSSLGIASVQFLLDGSSLGSAVAAFPYSTTWNTASAANGAHTLSAVATDTAGSKTTSASVAVTVSNAPPPPSCPVSGATWQNNAVTSQSTAFQAAFDATPNMANMDGMTGLSMGPASDFSSLATIVRFNNTGTIDARNGGAYAAAAVIPYTAGSTYHIREVVDPVNHVYSVYVTPPGAAEQTLGLTYAFRSEQAATSTLNNWAIFADAGTHQVCNFALSSAPPSPSPTPTPAPSPSPTPTPSPTPVIGNYDATVLNDKPIAFWDMKNPTGTETDLTGNGHNGTYRGGAPALTTLPDGEQVDDFNTTASLQQYMTVASPADKSFSIPTTKQLTWEAWIRPDVSNFASNAGSGYVDWMGKCEVYGGNTSQEPCEWEARMYSTTTQESPNRPNRVSGYVFNAGAGLGSAADWQPAYTGPSSNVYASSIIQPKDWLHVVAEYQIVNNGSYASCGSPVGTISIWVNGVMWSQSNHAPTGCFSQYSVTPSAGSSPLDIGTMALDSWFQGAIGKVAIYNTLLSQSQISAHYAAMTGTQPSGSCGDTCTAAFTLSK